MIRNDISRIILQYGEKNSRIAFVITIITIIVTIGKFLLEVLEKKREEQEISHQKRRFFADRKLGSIFFRLYWFVLFFLFIFYFCFLVELTLLTREAGSRTDISLKFLGTWHPDIYSQCFMIENVLLFLPFGMLLVLLWKHMRKIWKIVAASLFLSIAIEVTQLLTKRGYFQVDDIWLNIAGGILGACLGMVVRGIFCILIYAACGENGQKENNLAKKEF